MNKHKEDVSQTAFIAILFFILSANWIKLFKSRQHFLPLSSNGDILQKDACFK